MILDLTQVFLGEKKSLPVDCTLDFSELDYQNDHPFFDPVRVVGKVSAESGIVKLKAVAHFVYQCACDRCLDTVSRQMEIPIEHVLVTSLNSDDDGEHKLVEHYKLVLEDLVREDLIISVPSKNLCRDDCRGLCPHCGINLNTKSCVCQSEKTDNRFKILEQLKQSDLQ